MFTQEYNRDLIMKKIKNDTQKRNNKFNKTKAKNNTKSIEICLILINEKPSKVIIDTESNVSFINKEYYTEIDTPELYQDDQYILNGFGGEETKPIGYYFKHEMQVDGMKLTDNY